MRIMKLCHSKFFTINYPATNLRLHYTVNEFWVNDEFLYIDYNAICNINCEGKLI